MLAIIHANFDAAVSSFGLSPDTLDKRATLKGTLSATPRIDQIS